MTGFAVCLISWRNSRPNPKINKSHAKFHGTGEVLRTDGTDQTNNAAEERPPKLQRIRHFSKPLLIKVEFIDLNFFFSKCRLPRAQKWRITIVEKKIEKLPNVTLSKSDKRCPKSWWWGAHNYWVSSWRPAQVTMDRTGAKKENLNLNEKLSISLVIRFAKTGLWGFTPWPLLFTFTLFSII